MRLIKKLLFFHPIFTNGYFFSVSTFFVLFSNDTHEILIYRIRSMIETKSTLMVKVKDPAQRTWVALAFQNIISVRCCLGYIHTTKQILTVCQIYTTGTAPTLSHNLLDIMSGESSLN